MAEYGSNLDPQFTDKKDFIKSLRYLGLQTGHLDTDAELTPVLLLVVEDVLVQHAGMKNVGKRSDIREDLPSHIKLYQLDSV